MVVSPVIWALITESVPEGLLSCREAIWCWSVLSSVFSLSIWTCTSAWIWSTYAWEYALATAWARAGLASVAVMLS